MKNGKPLIAEKSGKPLIAETRARIQVGMQMAIGIEPSLEDVMTFAAAAEGRPVLVGTQGSAYMPVGKVLESPSRDIEKEGWWIKYAVDDISLISVNSALMLRALSMGAMGAHPLVKVSVEAPVDTHEELPVIKFEEVGGALLDFFDPMRWSNEFHRDKVHKIWENPIERNDYGEVKSVLGDRVAPDLVSLLSSMLMYGERMGLNDSDVGVNIGEYYDLLVKAKWQINAREALSMLESVFNLFDMNFKHLEEDLKK